MEKISLSHTTMNAAIKEPHTYLNKMMGLKTFQTVDMAAGDVAHGIIQRHVSGVELHPILQEKGLPTFSLVEREKWDDQMRVNFDINDKYYFTGFLDADDPGRLDLAEFKFGKPWSAGEFARLVQWKLYAIGRPEYTKIWFVNAPKEPEAWNNTSIKIYNMDILQSHKDEAWLFIRKALAVIENIKEEVEKAEELKKEKGWRGRSRFCFYIGCEWCGGQI